LADVSTLPDVAPETLRTASAAQVRPRLDSVDLLRGIIMVIMSLDHVRDYLTYLPFPPEDMQRTWPALFFTRWITHFCAPLFFFLAGTGVFLSGTRGRSPQEVRHLLWTRGLWLVVLELTVVGFGWTFLPWGYAGVIWALGWSMVLMSLIIRMPLRWVAAFGLVMIFTHNLFDVVQVQSAHGLGWLWMLLHQPGFLPIAPKIGLFAVLYVLVPWVGVIAAGYALGAVILMEAPRRRRWLVTLGVCAIALFCLLRATNFYGQPSDPRVAFASVPQFHVQPTLAMTVVAFLNVQKYPPALQFLLMTLGPGLLALALFDRFDMARRGLGRAVVVFGRVPMFYYVLHIYTIHLAAGVIALAFHQPVKWLFPGAFFFQRPPDGYGHSLKFIYVAWTVINILLYFPCRWFAEYKRTHRAWWLSYI
jgi:uncharacterized membrane protein